VEVHRPVHRGRQGPRADPASSDAHARNVATAFAEASAALYAAADVNVPDAGSVFDDHN
jgi:DNA-binding helix-hairpin-helix protein with protein kinase domain